MRNLLIIALFLLLLPGAVCAGEKDDCLDRIQRTEEMMMEVRHNYAYWYIDPTVWRGFTLAEKENIISGLSHCRRIVNGYGMVEIKDGYSGKTLGKMTVMSGPKIIK